MCVISKVLDTQCSIALQEVLCQLTLPPGSASRTCFHSTVPASPHGFRGSPAPAAPGLLETCRVRLGLHSVVLRQPPGGKVLPRCGRREGETLGALRGGSRGIPLPPPPTSLVSRGGNPAPSLPTHTPNSKSFPCTVCFSALVILL